VGDAGLHSVTEQPRGGVSLPRYLGYYDSAARNVAEAATPADRDLRLIDYFKVRKLMGETIHRFFGDPGLTGVPQTGHFPAGLTTDFARDFGRQPQMMTLFEALLLCART